VRLSSFIQANLDEIVGEWETFAQTLLPAAGPMSLVELRDHAKDILEAIVKDLSSYQSSTDQTDKSKGLDPAGRGGQWAASIHGRLRHDAGFDLNQLASEYRALRASVIRLWMKSCPDNPREILEDTTRFNEAIDEALADSIEKYSSALARSRNTFIGMLGHDLRAPLNAVSLAAQYLSMPNMTNAERLPAASRITRSVKTMDAMIRDLLEFAREKLGNGIPLSTEDSNIGLLCRTAVEDIQIIAPGHDVRLEMSGDLNGKFDAPRMQQVLSNLLGNAVKHSPRSIPILVKAHGDAQHIFLAVTNRGSVIPEDSLEAIFDPLVQLPGDEEPSTSIGLGLYIARQIMIAHGGTLHATSSAEAGTTFTAKLLRL
jgi:signal transduction histidine kinase